MSRSRFHLSSVCSCEKTLQKAKKLFKVSLLSLSKDSLVNCFWENLSFWQFIMLYCRLIYMLSILCVRLTIKVKVGIPESFKVGWYPPQKTGSSHLNEIQSLFS